MCHLGVEGALPVCREGKLNIKLSFNVCTLIMETNPYQMTLFAKPTGKVKTGHVQTWIELVTGEWKKSRPLNIVKVYSSLVFSQAKRQSVHSTIISSSIINLTFFPKPVGLNIPPQAWIKMGKKRTPPPKEKNNFVRLGVSWNNKMPPWLPKHWNTQGFRGEFACFFCFLSFLCRGHWFAYLFMFWWGDMI